MEHSNLKGITFLRNLIFILIIAAEIILTVRVFATSFGDSVLIGGSGPADSKAELDVKSTSKGVLLPRMTTTQQNAIVSPTEGLLIYDNVLHQLSNYNGTSWTSVGGTPAAATTSTLGTVKALAAVSHQFLTGITSGTGVPTQAQPAFTDISGTATIAQGGTGQITQAAAIDALTGTQSGGTYLRSDGTHATLTAIQAADVPTLNQNTSGSAAKWTTARNLAGNSVDGSANVAFANKFIVQGTTDTGLSGAQFMGALGTGIVKNTTTTGVMSIAVAGDFPTLNQNTSGTAANVTGVVAIANGGTNNASLGVTAGGVIYSDGSKLMNVGAGAAGQVLKSQGASPPQWGAASGGLISDREMITNTDIEVDASGYTAYADAAGVKPVACTGGSPNSTIARSTSTPITGTGELLWSKTGGATRQGEGFSIPFTVGTADQAKVLQVDLDSIIRSGTFVAGSNGVDSDLEFYIYDVTNSALIQPTTYKIYSTSTALPLHSTLNFQTSSSGTSYRLCVHTSTSSTANYTVGFDNISIHPSRYAYGTPITDWTSWTPTGTWSTNTTYTGFWRRVGGNAQFQVRIALAGAPTSANLAVNLPSGLTVDTTKLSSATTGSGIPENTAHVIAAGVIYPGQVVYNNTTSVAVQSLIGSASTNSMATVTQLIPGTFANADAIDLEWSEPIVGWSSAVQMSDSAPQSAVASRYSLNSNQTGVNTNASAVKIVFTDATTSPNFDTSGAFSSGTYTAKIPGIYSFSPVVTVAATNVLASLYQLRLYKNGSYVEVLNERLASVGAQFTIGGATANVSMNAGDTVDIYLFGAGNNSASTLTLVGTTDATYCSVTRLGGPVSIGATETVSAKYTNSAATSIASDTNDHNVPFATKVWDSHGAWNGTQYVCPISGKYQITATATFSTAIYAVANLVYGSIYQNTVLLSYGPLNSVMTTTSIIMSGSVSTTADCKAGDTLEFKLSNNRTAGATALAPVAADNHIEIERIGM